MDYTLLVDPLPLWLLFVVALTLVIGSVELGYRAGLMRRIADASGPTEKEAPVGAIVAATLGLLAFILGFTFSLSASRFDERRRMAVDESNAIGTAYLRAGMLAEPESSAARDLLRQYVDVRLSLIEPAAIESGIARSTALHAALWTQASQAVAKDSRSIPAGLFIQALNEVIDLHSKRALISLHSRLPGLVWLVLCFIAMGAMGSLGYQQGLAGSRRSLAVGALALTFSAVVFLIADLDRPQEGLLRVSQWSMLELQRSLKDPAAK